MAKNIRIAMCGSQGTGKSTLATSLHEVLSPGFELITYSRPTAAAIKIGYSSARDVPPDEHTQWKFQVEALFEQLRAEKSAKTNLIIDRSVWDYLGYLSWKFPYLRSTEKFELYEKIVTESSNYDYLFFVPFPGGSIEDNGIRLLTPPEPVEVELQRLFDKWNIHHYTLKQKTLKTRLDEVLGIIGA